MGARNLAATLVLLCACGATTDQTRTLRPLAGQWSLVLTVEASPRGSVDAGRRLTGSAAFVLSDSGDGNQAYGAYSLEPAADAIVGNAKEHGITATRLADDSLRIVFGPANSEFSVELRGRQSANDSITGIWSTVLARSASSRGRFVMLRK